jgi:hypothetical protein
MREDKFSDMFLSSSSGHILQGESYYSTTSVLLLFIKFCARIATSATTWELAPKSEESLVLKVFFSVFLPSSRVSGLIFF